MAKKKSDIRIGIAGCGHIGHWHVGCLKHIEGARVVAAADPAVQNAQSLAAKAGGGCKVYADPQEMIETAEIDALYLCVPPMSHGAYEKAAVKRGLPMFIEKPITPDLKLARRICDMLPCGLPISVAYNWRYMPNVDAIAKLLKKNKPIGFLAVWKEGLPPARWWRVVKTSGGPIIEQASHLLDIGMYFLGPIKAVTALSGYYRKRDFGDIDDLYMVNLEFESGAIGQLIHTCLLNSRIHRIGFDVICRDLEVSCERDASVTIRSKEGVRQLPGGYDKSYVAESEAFLKAVRTGNTGDIRCDYEEAMASIALGEAIYKSGKTGKRVLVEKV